MSHQSDLFFYDQCNRRRKYKRYRKPPELLPFSVRLTGLSGAVKVEAYLRQQQQKVGESQGKDKGASATAVEKDSETPDAPSRAGFLGLDREGEGKRQAGKALNLPDIGVRHFQAPLAIRSFEQLDGDDEEEDTQRFLFEENKFAAPNLLAQLGRLIDHIHENQLEELEEIQSTSSHFGRSSTAPGPEISADESVVSETIRGGGVVIPLPDDLHNKLRCNYDELSANAVYVKREWQTASYREQAILQKRLGIMSETQANFESPKSHVDFNAVTTTVADQSKSSHEKSSVKGNNSKDSKRKKSVPAEQMSKADPTDGSKRDDLATPTAESVSDLYSRRESVASKTPNMRLPRTRFERLKMQYNNRANGRFTV